MCARSGLTLEEIVLDVTTIHSLPIVYTQLFAVIDDPRSSIADISKIISEDQGLIVRILKLSNSPMFGYFPRIETVTQAVTIIGVQQVRDISLAIAVMDVFKGISEELVNMEQIWRHSVATGLTARILASARRETNVERFFVSGILHDIGRLVMFIRIPDVCRQILEECRQRSKLVHKVERERLSFDHADVGRYLMQRWKIPPSLSGPIAYHHNCSRAGIYQRDASIIHFADIIAHAMELGNSGEKLVPTLDTKAWDNLEISTFDLSFLLHQVDANFANTVQALFSRAGRS